MSSTTLTRSPSSAGVPAVPTARKRPKRLLANTICVILAVVVAFPLYWMVISALKPKTDLEAGDASLIPSTLSLDSFRRVFAVNDFGLYFMNSVIVALATVLITIILSFLASVAVARFKFRFRTSVLIVVLIAQMLPIEALAIPMFFMFRNFGFAVPAVGLNHLGSLVIVHVAFSIPFTIWMLRGFVAAVPVDLEEAAAIDGATGFRFVRSILFPLVAPGVVACGVFSFISTWNDFLFAKTFIISNTDNQTLPLALLGFFKPDENDWGAIMAGSVIMTVPVMIMFMLVQKKLVSGLAGAVKG